MNSITAVNCTKVDMNIKQMTLTDTEQKQIKDWAKNWGEDSANQRVYYLKCKSYIDEFLTSTKISRGQPFNCYHEGKDSYCRKDGQPINEEDIKAITQSSPGQGSTIKGKAGDLNVIHEWFIDSSD